MSGATAKRSTALLAPAAQTAVGSLLQRKCACGSSKSPLGQSCDQCQAHGLQAKLAVGTSDGPLEHEADRVADQVLAGPAQEKPRSSPLRIQRYSAKGDGQGGSSAPASVDRALASPGRPLDAPLRRDMESRFGHDFSQVRIHTGDAAKRSARDVSAHAYTVGQHIVMGPSAAGPSTPAGRRLLAHELVHTVQQRSSVSQVQRWKAPVTSVESAEKQESSANPPEAFLQGGWREVNELGIVYKEGPLSKGGGANLKDAPGGKVLQWLPHNTKVFVLKHNAKQQVYAVTLVGDKTTLGYVSQSHLWLGLPDPESDIYRVKPGDTSLDIARAHYGGKGFNDAWYADQRYVVNALYWANRHQKKTSDDAPSIVKKDTYVEMGGVKILFKAESDDAPWQTVQVVEGKLLWLPGVEFLRSLYSTVRKKGGGTGSIKAEVWQTVKGAYEKAAYFLAFIGGIVHGFLKSIWDAIAGIAELLFGFLKSLLTGEIINDAKKLGEAVSKMTWAGLKEALGNWADKWHAKLTDDSPWVRGHAHGYLTGYVMAEALMMLISGGAITEAKAIVWSSKLGKVMKTSRAVKAMEATSVAVRRGIHAVGGPAKRALDTFEKTRTGKVVIATARVASKAARWTAKWLGEVLNLPATIVKFLFDPFVKKLMKVENYFPRIREFGNDVKKWLLGCRSPCDCDADFIDDMMKMKLSEKQLHERAMAAARAEARTEARAERAAKKSAEAKKAPTKPAAAEPTSPAPLAPKTLPPPTRLSRPKAPPQTRAEFIQQHRDLLGPKQREALDKVGAKLPTKKQLRNWERTIDKKLRRSASDAMAEVLGVEPRNVTASRRGSSAGSDWEVTTEGIRGDVPNDLVFTVRTKSGTVQYDSLGNPGGSVRPMEIKSYDDAPDAPRRRAPAYDGLDEMREANRVQAEYSAKALADEERRAFTARKLADQMERQARQAIEFGWPQVEWPLHSKQVTNYFLEEVLPLVDRKLRPKIRLVDEYFHD